MAARGLRMSRSNTGRRSARAKCFRRCASKMADRQAFSNISATTSPFRLAGGKYGVDCAATFGGGSVKLQKLAGDASTYVSVSTPTDFAAAGYATIDLP